MHGSVTIPAQKLPDRTIQVPYGALGRPVPVTIPGETVPAQTIPVTVSDAAALNYFIRTASLAGISEEEIAQQVMAYIRATK